MPRYLERKPGPWLLQGARLARAIYLSMGDGSSAGRLVLQTSRLTLSMRRMMQMHGARSRFPAIGNCTSMGSLSTPTLITYLSMHHLRLRTRDLTPAMTTIQRAHTAKVSVCLGTQRMGPSTYT